MRVLTAGVDNEKCQSGSPGEALARCLALLCLRRLLEQAHAAYSRAVCACSCEQRSRRPCAQTDCGKEPLDTDEIGAFYDQLYL